MNMYQSSEGHPRIAFIASKYKNAMKCELIAKIGLKEH
jgi:hypothetical protein